MIHHVFLVLGAQNQILVTKLVSFWMMIALIFMILAFDLARWCYNFSTLPHALFRPWLLWPGSAIDLRENL